MTQHGSFPGRPRGRRARPDNDASEWAGYDATPADEREFPDLSPIRPREARARDGRTQDDWQAQGQAGSYGAAYHSDAGDHGYPPTGPGQPGAGYQDSAFQGGYGATGQGSLGQGGLGQGGLGQGGLGQGGYGAAGQGGGYGAAGQAGPGQGGQAPWQDQPWPGQQPGGQPVTQAAAASQTGKPRAGAARHAAKGGKDTDAPEWAGPDVDAVEQFSERWERRGMDTRDDRRADRTKHRRRLVAAAVAGVLVVGGAAYYLIGKPGQHSNANFGALVNSFLPGELQSVPDACTAVPVAMLNQYLPGNSPKNTKRA